MKSMPIEKALEWAYRDELPKGGCSFLDVLTGPATWKCSLAGVAAAGQLGATVMSATFAPINEFGVVADRMATALPHPDALVIHEAVQALSVYEIDVPNDWALLEGVDLHGHDAAVLAAALAAVNLYRRPMPEIIRTVAICGLPDCTIDQPELKYVMGARGQPKWFVRARNGVELDGYDAKAKRAKDGAYRKTYLDPDPSEAFAARAVCEAWRAALDVLVIDLEGRLSDIEVWPSSLPDRPWMRPEAVVIPCLLERGSISSRKSRGNLKKVA